MARIVEFTFKLGGEDCSAWIDDDLPEPKWQSDQKWVADHLNAAFDPSRSMTFGMPEYTAARKAHANLGGELKVATLPEDADVF